ncbi:MAG: serine/threonine protein kinase, CMGC, CDC2/CDK sub [Icmadophila ericetorum]|nr:serine/threonine protein kinase, CMGC, CDC2/CDK sub [Icmadophila ericetorum]
MSLTSRQSSASESRRLGSHSLEKTAEGRPRFAGCSSIKNYEILGKLGEGTFGEVYKARSTRYGHQVALKKILMHNEKDGFPITALREIRLLKMLSHPNILKLEEMAVERAKGEGRKKATMYMVTPYMDHDLSGLLENPAVHITEPQIKCYMIQLLEGLRYLHGNQILHRDMKAANLLINNRGVLQIADFGLARPYDDPPPEPGRGGGEGGTPYTTLVVTRWYRPPELLLQLRHYTTAIDMWGVGCVFGEMFKGRPILAGNSDLNQAQMIFDLVGTPNEENMPGWSSLPGCEGVSSFTPRSSTLAQVFREQGSSVISLLAEFLKLDWRKRINANDALQHPYFKTPPLPAKPGELPQFEESHELDRRKFRGQKAKLPPAPAGGTVGMGINGEWMNGGIANGNNPPNHISSRRPPVPPPVVVPRNNYDGRPPAPPIQRGPPLPSSLPDHRPGWHRDPGLPPRPPPSNMGWQNWGGEGVDSNRSRSTVPRPAPTAYGTSRVDTYIPSYGNGSDVSRSREEGTNRQDRGERGRHGDRGPYEAARKRSRSPPIRDKERYRDRDVYRR